MSVLLTSLALCLNLVAPPQAAAKPGPRENVETAVVEAIRLLEAKDYKTFLPQFVPPDDYKVMVPTPEALDTTAERFGPRSERLLIALREASTLKPTFDAAKTSATYTLNVQLLDTVEPLAALIVTGPATSAHL